jgi:hypothetical protein
MASTLDLTTLSSDVRFLVEAVKADPINATARLVLADAIAEASGDYSAALAAANAIQATEEGAEIVTVGRDGADTAGHGNVIYTTKIYRAVRRKDNGILVWRLSHSAPGHRTAGKKITQPMIGRAKGRAEEMGVEFVAHVTHGQRCK